MAVVYAATHRNQKRFAIKMLHPELSSRQDVRARFLREGYAANTVDHPGAVAVLDDDISESGVAFLVMELLDGDSVERIWAKSGHKIPVGPALAVVHQLMDILAAAHAKSTVHRDIKPANLFVTREGQLKVLDFGIARVRDIAASMAHITGTGLVLGTPAFMAPEQALAKSEEIDARTDVWAAGATLFTLLTGRNVHEGENGQQVLIRAATTPAPSLASVAPDAPRSVMELVDRALAFDRSQRWSSAEVMRDVVRTSYLSICGRIAWQTSLLALLSEGEPRIGSGQYAEPYVPWPTPPLPFDVNAPNLGVEALEEPISSRPSKPGSGRGGAPHIAPTLDQNTAGHPGVPTAGRGSPVSSTTSGVGGTISQAVASEGRSARRASRSAMPSRHSVSVGAMLLAAGIVAMAVARGTWTTTGSPPPVASASEARIPSPPAATLTSAVGAPATSVVLTPAVSAQPDVPPATSPSGEPKSPSSPPTRIPAASAATPGAEGFLTINSLPPSVCYLDGREIGEAPRVHVSVTPGRHIVTFVVPDQGVAKTISVTVDAGETKVATAKLDIGVPTEPPPEIPGAQPLNCDPPYTWDENGQKRYNIDCLRR
jgi:serine/threonine-protein kinase